MGRPALLLRVRPFVCLDPGPHMLVGAQPTPQQAKHDTLNQCWFDVGRRRRADIKTTLVQLLY